MSTIQGAGTIVGPFAASGDGRRAMRVDWGSVTCLVQSTVDGPEIPEHEASDIARAPIVIVGLLALVAELEVEVARLRVKLPPDKPVALLATGCVRQQDGALYLLHRPDRGFGEWGVRLEGWDDLFRRYDVIVGDPRTDEHGQYWPVDPRRREPEALI